MRVHCSDACQQVFGSRTDSAHLRTPQPASSMPAALQHIGTVMIEHGLYKHLWTYTVV